MIEIGNRANARFLRFEWRFGLNKGIARATGEVVGLLHADDVYADPQVLARVAAAFADPAVQAASRLN